MNEEFTALYRRICQPITFEELRRLYAELKRLGDYSDDLLAALKAEVEAKRWGCVTKLIWAIPHPTPRLFSPILCLLLDQHRQVEIMEAVADAMFDLRDEDTIPSLAGVLECEVPGDADSHFNRKIIDALANIGTPDAVAAIRLALDHPEETVRRTAAKELQRINSKT